MSLWFFVGMVSLIWVLSDLFTEKVFFHRVIYKKYDPMAYWLVWSLWMGLSIGIILLS